MASGEKVPRILCGGTGSFPIFAELSDPAIELSPGTITFHDAGYREIFPDLKFTPAALLLTRVISRPTPNRITLDLGYKVRQHSLAKVPWIAAVGAREAEQGSVAVRRLGEQKQESLALGEALALFLVESRPPDLA